MQEMNSSNPEFLEGDGNATSLIRSLNWSDHSLGPIDTWPTSLQISLNIVLQTNLPMILFWGTDYICFYNDDYMSLLASNGDHPESIGRKGQEVWEDKWEPVKLQLDHVRQGEEAIWSKDSSLLINQNGSDDPINWRHSCSPVKDESGDIRGVLVTCQKMSSTTAPDQALKEAYEEKTRILESITDGFISVNGDWIITHWNLEAEKLLGIKRSEVIGKNLWGVFPEAKQQDFYPAIKKAMKRGEPVSFESFYDAEGKWFSVKIYPVKKGYSVYFQNITEQRRFQLINKRTEEISGVAGWEYDVATRKIFMTPKAFEIYGLPDDQQISLETNEELFDEESLDKIENALTNTVNQQKSYQIELNLIKSEGDPRIIQINGFPEVEDGKVKKVYGTLEDITLKKQREKEREEVLQKLTTAQNIAKLGYWTHDIEKNISNWSDNVYNIWGQNPQTFTPDFETLLETIHPEDRELFLGDASEAFPDKNYYDTEHRIITPDGEVKWILERITLHRDEEGVAKVLEGIVQDITKKKEQEEKTLQALNEKEILLAEIHHRVKNNLAAISGMLQLQAFEEESSSVREKLLDSVTRIVSMASIHEQLYQSKSFSKLNFSANLENLVTKIVNTMQIKTPIELDFDLDPVQLNINQAIPYSLIVNEVITNILKHAFKGKKKGKITFKLTEKGDHLNLLIKDNGAGMPEGVEDRPDKSLGLRLIDILSQQLKATYKYNSTKSGTVFSIQFEKSDVKGTGSANI